MFKSIKTSVIAFILIGTALIARAQKVIDQGTLTYGIEYLLTEEQKTQFDASLLPSESKVKFNGNISQVQIDMGAAFVKVLTDASVKNSLVLVDIPIMHKQYAARLSKEALAAQRGNLSFSDYKATGEKMEIAGYTAEKYTCQDNHGTRYDVWVAPDLELSAGARPAGFDSLKGTPVKFVNIQDGFKSVLTLKSVKKEPAGPFSMDVPKGYEMKTMEEMRAMQGGGK